MARWSRSGRSINHRKRTVPDYVDLFEPIAPWNKAAEAVQVFKTSTQFLANAPDDTLSHMFADLKRRNIALGMEALMLTTTASVALVSRGYGGPQTMEIVASRVQRGGDLRYVAMDEPLDFGHYSHQPNACQSSLADLAADIAGKVRAIRRIFPEVQIGDIEGLGRSGPEGDVDGLMEWTRLTKLRSARLLASSMWTWCGLARGSHKLQRLAARLRAAGIKFGIIYNGNPDDQSGLAWTPACRAALRRC